ncbi:MAG TPA: lipopolysaccharide biosynthesis protein [Steroidobacteraceae bacterium]|jgi:O-antigen/teichoic acid export membrane protein|nr:lipopolysaccharide biosynthesis protein [Steroidobacteraceae bacterium]
MAATHDNPGEDLTGKARLKSNVLWSWGAQLVFVASGFVMPRMIDASVGQAALGVWDFCWSIVSYLGLANFGFGSSVNRYVATYRAAGELDNLSRAVSSVAVIQAGVGTLMLITSLVLAWGVPGWFQDRLGTHADTTRLVVGFLGASIAVQLCFDAFRGVITGCHRWDLHNGVQAGTHAMTTIGMLAALLLGGNLGSLAIVYFTCALCGELVRMTLALRVCPGLKIRPRNASWAFARQMATFGSKSLVLGLPPLLVTQSVSVALAAHLGPAKLAILSRPLGLVRQLETFLNKFNYVLAPMVGSLHQAAQHEERRKLFIESARWSVALALPPTLMLAILGDAFLDLWMGPNYLAPGLMATMAGGMFLASSQGPAAQVLTGMNRHGRIAIVNIVLVLLVLVSGTILFGEIGWTLHRAALLIIASLVPPYGVLLPIYACRRLQVPLSLYLRRIFLAPLLCGIPLAAVLWTLRVYFRGEPFLILASGGLVGGLLTCGLYWNYVMTQNQRTQVLQLLRINRVPAVEGKQAT